MSLGGRAAGKAGWRVDNIKKVMRERSDPACTLPAECTPRHAADHPLRLEIGGLVHHNSHDRASVAEITHFEKPLAVA
jgi:hypothetical protein